MSLKANKSRIAISLTEDQLNQLEEVAGEMGLTKSDLISIATSQYIASYHLSKDITKSAISDAISKALKEGDISIEQFTKQQ